MTDALQMKSLITQDGELQLALHEMQVKAPGPDEVVVRVEASPINPSDQGVLFGPADISQAVTEGSGNASVLKAPMLKGGLARVAARLGKPLAVGNEGAGVVVEAGSSDAAQALMGRTVAVFGGAMYAQFRTAHVMACLPLNEGTTAEQGASCFVNPLTALGMVETMKMEGHTALVHTAAASNLGQMLNRICQSDGVSLVNIVRKPAQVKLLKDAGAKYVVNSSEESFRSDLTDALAETGATIGFDATGGGTLASEILAGMERAAARTGTDYSIYGSTAHKQVYLYGGLDTSPTLLNRSYGMAWGVGGWLLPPFLERVGPETAGKMRQRVADELTTTFASHYTQRLSLAEALQADTVKAYEGKTTGEKYLITPQA